MKDLSKFPQLPVTSYTPFLPLPCRYVSQSSINLWLQVMKDLLMFPQLPVTPFPPFTLTLCLPIIYYFLASSNKRLTKVSKVTSYQLHPFLPVPCHYVFPSLITLWLQGMSLTTVTSYLTTLVSVCHHHSFSLWLQVTKDLLKFPQLPVTSFTLSSLYLAVMSPIIYYSLASRNVRLTTIPTVTSYLTTLVSRCVSITLSLSGFK